MGSQLCFSLFRNFLDRPTADHSGFTDVLAAFGKDANTKIYLDYPTCVDNCGHTIYFFDRDQVAGILLTWGLPVVFLTSNAPFVSNDAAGTFRALSRWLGSSISSLTQIFLSLRASDNCAYIVQSSTVYDVRGDALKGPNFQEIRNSFYLLSAMNHFTIEDHIPRADAEAILRKALFAQTLGTGDRTIDLVSLRRQLAGNIRKHRQQGAIVGLASTVAFLICFGYSWILALLEATSLLGIEFGIFAVWLPALILAASIDHNLCSAESSKEELNDFIGKVRRALLPQAMQRQPHNPPSSDSSSDPESDKEPERFFCRFAGQGREPFHYGSTGHILSSIFWSGIGVRDEGWLDESAKEDLASIESTRKYSFSIFTRSFAGASLCAILVVGSAFAGALMYEIRRPPIGIALPSGTYLIYMVVSLSLFITEWVGLHLALRVSKTPSSDLRVLGLILRIFESLNSIFFGYSLIARAIGIAESCDHLFKLWAPAGRDATLSLDVAASNPWTSLTLAGALVPLTTLLITITVLVIQWLSQSHLGTANEENARRGLMRTRKIHKRAKMVRDFFIFPLTAAWAGLRRLFSAIFRKLSSCISHQEL